MKHPLLTVALALALGILAGECCPWPPPVFPMMIAAWVLGAVAVAWARARPVLLWPLLALTGATGAVLHAAVLSPRDLRVLFSGEAALVTVRGRLTETPHHRVYGQAGEGEELVWRTLVEIHIDEVREKSGAWRPAFGRVAASVSGLLPEAFVAGQRVEVAGVLKRPRRPIAPGQFDYPAYLRWRGVHRQLETHSLQDWQALVPQRARPWSDRFAAWARVTLARGLPAEDEPLRLLWAMALGWKTALTGEVSEPFMRSGTMHVFAISGLHVVLIAGILVGVLRVAGVPRGLCGGVVAALLWFYTGATGWQASAVRSTIMMSVIIGGWALHRPSDLLNSLGAAAFLILLWDPLQLFQAGFQLSFSVVLSLALFLPPLQRLRDRWLAPDPLLPEELRPAWQQWLFRAARAVLSGVFTSVAAFIGAVPLVAWYFHLFTPVSLLANFVVVPASSAALAAALGSLGVGGWWPWLGELFNHSAWFFVWLMTRMSQWAAELPGACYYVPAPTFLGFVFYYAVLASGLAGWLQRPRTRRWACAGLGALALAAGVEWRVGQRGVRLTLVPLQGGELARTDAPGRKNDLLVDCGGDKAVEFLVKPFLRSEGVNRLPCLLLTHGDVRQAGGAAALLERFPAIEICLGASPFRSASYREMRRQLEDSRQRVRELRPGDRIGLWTVLHPAAEDRFNQADDAALVLHGSLEGTRVLLLSDLGKPGQNALLERHPDLRADIVISGLPSQGEPLAEALIDALRPKLIVVTDSEYPATARAGRRLRERLAQRDCPVIYTMETGAVTLRFRPGAWSLRTASGVSMNDRASGTTASP